MKEKWVDGDKILRGKKSVHERTIHTPQYRVSQKAAREWKKWKGARAAQDKSQKPATTPVNKKEKLQNTATTTTTYKNQDQSGRCIQHNQAKIRVSRLPPYLTNVKNKEIVHELRTSMGPFHGSPCHANPTLQQPIQLLLQCPPFHASQPLPYRCNE